MSTAWWEYISYGIGLVGLVFGTIFWLKWNQFIALLAALGKAFTNTSYALEDKQLTQEEAVKLLKDWMDAVNLLISLLPKGIQTKCFSGR